MNGYTNKDSHTADKPEDGGGFAAEEPRVPGATPGTAAPSDSSQQEDSVMIPMPLYGAGIVSGEHGAFEMGWNLCLQFIRWDNPNIKFKEWVYTLENKKPV